MYSQEEADADLDPPLPTDPDDAVDPVEPVDPVDPVLPTLPPHSTVHASQKIREDEIDAADDVEATLDPIDEVRPALDDGDDEREDDVADDGEADDGADELLGLEAPLELVVAILTHVGLHPLPY